MAVDYASLRSDTIQWKERGKEASLLVSRQKDVIRFHIRG